MATPLTLRAFGLSTRAAKTLIQTQANRCSCYLYSTTAADSDASKGESSENEANKKQEEMAAQIKKLEEDAKDTKDKYMRALAETENLRRRMVKQVDDAKLFGIQGFCKDLLEVSDILSSALSAVPTEELTDANPHLVNLHQGLEMTHGQLAKVFSKHGLVRVAPAEGEKFDPNLMEALFNVPAPPNGPGDGTVAHMQQAGFTLHQRTIRPAKVGVFKS